MFIFKYILKEENKQLIDVNLNRKVTFLEIALTFPMFSDVPKFFPKKGQSNKDKTGVWHLIYGRIWKKVVLHVCGLMSAALLRFALELFNEFYSY